MMASLPTFAAAIAHGYRPFVTPLPVWDFWYLLVLPLCIAVAIVWKSIKCKSMDQVPREAAVITFWILVGLTAAAILLSGVVKAFER